MVRPERMGMVTFEVWGNTDAELAAHARRVLDSFGADCEYRCKIDAIAAIQSGDGSVLSWRGDVQAWPTS
jgi:hypothetical protein